jgi:hypothetical protein
MRNHDRKRINEPILEDEDKAVERRTWKRLKAERFERPAMQLIEKCIDAEEGSVYKMALRHLNNDQIIGGRNAADQLLDAKFLPLDEESNVNDQMAAYCLLDDLNASVLEAYITGYMAAFTGGSTDEQ